MAHRIDRSEHAERAKVPRENRVAAFRRTRGRSTGILALSVLAFLVFVKLRSLVEAVGMSVRFPYVIRLDQRLDFGHDPIVWLQARLHPAAGVGPLDYALVAIWVTYFVVPPILSIVL